MHGSAVHGLPALHADKGVRQRERQAASVPGTAWLRLAQLMLLPGFCHGLSSPELSPESLGTAHLPDSTDDSRQAFRAGKCQFETRRE